MLAQEKLARAWMFGRTIPNTPVFIKCILVRRTEPHFGELSVSDVPDVDPWKVYDSSVAFSASINESHGMVIPSDDVMNFRSKASSR